MAKKCERRHHCTGADTGNEFEVWLRAAGRPSRKKAGAERSVTPPPEMARNAIGGSRPSGPGNTRSVVFSRFRDSPHSRRISAPWVSGQKCAFGIPRTVICSERATGAGGRRSSPPHPNMNGNSTANIANHKSFIGGKPSVCNVVAAIVQARASGGPEIVGNKASTGQFFQAGNGSVSACASAVTGHSGPTTIRIAARLANRTRQLSSPSNSSISSLSSRKSARPA